MKKYQEWFQKKNMHIMGKVLLDLDSRKDILMKIRIFQTQKMKAELKAD